jgi:hypothetical protein
MASSQSRFWFLLPAGQLRPEKYASSETSRRDCCSLKNKFRFRKWSKLTCVNNVELNPLAAVGASPAGTKGGKGGAEGRARVRGGGDLKTARSVPKVPWVAEVHFCEESSAPQRGDPQPQPGGVGLGGVEWGGSCRGGVPWCTTARMSAARYSRALHLQHNKGWEREGSRDKGSVSINPQEQRDFLSSDDRQQRQSRCFFLLLRGRGRASGKRADYGGSGRRVGSRALETFVENAARRGARGAGGTRAFCVQDTN